MYYLCSFYIKNIRINRLYNNEFMFLNKILLCHFPTSFEVIVTGSVICAVLFLETDRSSTKRHITYPDYCYNCMWSNNRRLVLPVE